MKSLKHLLSSKAIDRDAGANFIFYMATPPSMYSVIAENLHAAGLADQETGFRRIIIEKPFGYDLESGRELNRKLHKTDRLRIRYTE